MNQMKWNMKAPNVKKINLKHQTTSVDLKVTFSEKFIRFAPYRFGRTLTNRSFSLFSCAFVCVCVSCIHCSNVCIAFLFVRIASSHCLYCRRAEFCWTKKDNTHTHTKTIKKKVKIVTKCNPMF